MGSIFTPQKVKFFCGLIYHESIELKKITKQLEEEWGEIEDIFESIPFEYTSYYNKEMGTPLWRTFVSFRKLINREIIIDRKLESNKIESYYTSNGDKRRVNIDPGYLTLGQLILVTTKDRDQRIYLGKGIYAEVTLRYSNNAYHAYPWTYRDYATKEYEEKFLIMRNKLKTQIKSNE